jgi:hypothetical protein
MFSEMLMMEKKDACYYKVKASAKVWPSAYASGRLVQCRKKGAGNYGNKSEGVAEGLHPMVIDDVKKLATLNPVDRYSAYGNIRGYFKADPELSKMASDLQGGYYEADMLRSKYKTDAAKAKYAELEPMHQAFIKQALGQEQGVAEGGPVTIGSKLPKSDTETFGLEPGRPYKINDPKDWKKGDRPRAIQQLIPTQDKKDHIRSRLGKHSAPVLPEQGLAENIRVEPVARSLKTQSTQTQPKQNVYVAPDKKTPAVVNHIKQKGMAEGEGNFAGDTMVNVAAPL